MDKVKTCLDPTGEYNSLDMFVGQENPIKFSPTLEAVALQKFGFLGPNL